MTPRNATIRDYRLELISRINRWLLACAVGIAGLLSLVAAYSFHGRTLAGGGAVAGSIATASQASSSVAGGGLQQPLQLPAPSAAAGSVVSGES